ncbi:hypothetical protein HMPREF9965_1833 [Streptococcus mitis bv. 2 str. SK95]|uniref:Uncharacterized protein n=1 Tax=Streptococcus mitis bv. 2 str. SK95 TaxID=1000588 RepID=F9LYE0_STROR|nr:DUF6773 family protein [Streptococcus mitis]EGU64147.1 hypothetical protein HMPREF9965_1833 [Streptococcus mitis bv. 2 str. SK95]
MKNRFFYYQLLDEREEQLINKAGTESFYVFIGLILLSYLVAVLAPALFNPDILLVTLLLGIFFFFNRARELGVTYYSRFHFTIVGCLLVTLAITTLLMLQNYQFNIEIYQHNPLNFKYLSTWGITYLLYFPWVFIGNLTLRNFGEWAQKKFEQDMDELETME